MIFWDTHLHTEFSGDSDTPVKDMVAAAMAKNLTGIVFTDHLDWNYPNEPGRFDLDFYEYLDTMKKFREENTDMEIGAGVELGLQPHLADRHREFLQKVRFDYCIGSVHVVNGVDPYYPGYFEGRSADDAYEEYFKCVLENISLFIDFDSLGHLDYVVRYGIRHKGEFAGRMDFNRHKPVIEEILSILIKNGKSLEVNTGSFRNGMREPNPSYDIIKLYYDMGGRQITVGSDAHKPDTVADGFGEVCMRLRNIGFSHYNVYSLRSAREMPLW